MWDLSVVVGGLRFVSACQRNVEMNGKVTEVSRHNFPFLCYQAETQSLVTLQALSIGLAGNQLGAA